MSETILIKRSGKYFLEEKEYTFDTFFNMLKEHEHNKNIHPVIGRWLKNGGKITTELTEDEKDLNIRMKLFDQAKAYENSGEWDKSLFLYYGIIRDFKPDKKAYFDEPAQLLIKLLLFDEAIELYDKACQKPEFFGDIKQELFEAIEHCNKLKNLYTYLIDLISESPGIIQSELIKSLNNHDPNDVRTLIYYMERNNKINREKLGRSYKLFICL